MVCVLCVKKSGILFELHHNEADYSKCTFELNYDNAVKPVKGLEFSKKA